MTFQVGDRVVFFESGLKPLNEAWIGQEVVIVEMGSTDVAYVSGIKGNSPHNAVFTANLKLVEPAKTDEEIAAESHDYRKKMAEACEEMRKRGFIFESIGSLAHHKWGTAGNPMRYEYRFRKTETKETIL